ncbi:MAG: motility associated factor glycosyltransferase family protein [Tissierellales bacterium]|nr:motility associated factor glycosyltransferase family protein [Tissierellales bacterium]
MQGLSNINYLKNNFPLAWEKIKDLDENLFEDAIIEEAKSGLNTLKIRSEGDFKYIHSKYDPLKEAQSIIKKNENNLEKSKIIIFFGTGLGYHIELILRAYPDIRAYIYEPNSEVLYYFLKERSFSESQLKRFRNIFIDRDSFLREIENIIRLNRDSLTILELPSYKSFYPDEYQFFIETIRSSIKNRRSNIITEYSFQKRWIINSMKNFKHVLNTPNVIVENKGRFKDKPAILVAAGPSLNEEIENIRKIKEEGLAYIFSVGSAINTLIANNIYPDAATTYDPTEHNQKVFLKVKEQNIKEIPLIFGSSVGYETIENYPGKLYHMITSQDKVSNYYLDNENTEPIDIVLDAPSIAVVTLQLLNYLGFNPIILAGQNLAYVGTKNHSEGVFYSNDLSDEELKNALEVKDVYGNTIKTNNGYNSARRQMELYIKQLKNLTVINTTKGGADIEGAPFMELEKVMNKYLNVKLVKDKFLENWDFHYDKSNLKDKSNRMDIYKNEAETIMKEYYTLLDKMENLLINNNTKELQNMYNLLNLTIDKIEENPYFNTFILQMNRLYHQLLSEEIKILSEEKNLRKKNEKLIKEYRIFMDRCKSDFELITPIYEELKENILEYCK